MVGIGPRLALVQRQALVMTPQLQQAIKLLQLSQQELAAWLRDELERNPLLAEAPGEDDGPGDPTAAQVAEAEAALAPERADTAGTLEHGASALADADERWTAEHADPGGDGSVWSGTRDGAGGGGAEDDGAARAPDREPSLVEHVLAQIRLEFADPQDRLVAVALLEMLDEAGYLRGDLAEPARRLGATMERIEAVRARLRRIDPPGLFARDLKECLAAQLADRDRLDPAMQALLDNLDLLARRDLPALRRRCGVDGEDLAEMIGELRALDPKPGLCFDAPPAAPIVPDIFLRPTRDPETGEGWRLELNSDTLPRVLVDRHYHATLLRGARRKEDREFLGERLQTANWLVKAIDQRAITILKVAREIVRQQDGFFRRGVGALRPLVLRDIAIAVEMHESTVSRVTSNKFIATPRGTFELKYFFTSAIASTGGAESVSAEAVRLRIRRLIDAEPAAEPLSDDRLVDLLGREGIEIARRTVAKYRDAMRIPSSAQRRRDKLMAGLGTPAPVALAAD